MRSVDTLVIGGGIAGLSLGARCVKHGSVVVLEAENAPGYHSSGRSVAHAHFGLGDEVIRALTALSMERLAEVPEDGSAPAGVVHQALHIASADDLDALDELEAQHRRFATDFERIGGIEAQDMVPILTDWSVNEAVLDRAALKLDADAMLQGHIRAIRSEAGQVHAALRSGPSFAVPMAGRLKRQVKAIGPRGSSMPPEPGPT